jgi:hypothetical protein
MTEKLAQEGTRPFQSVTANGRGTEKRGKDKRRISTQSLLYTNAYSRQL